MRNNEWGARTNDNLGVKCKLARMVQILSNTRRQVYWLLEQGECWAHSSKLCLHSSTRFNQQSLGSTPSDYKHYVLRAFFESIWDASEVSKWFGATEFWSWTLVLESIIGGVFPTNLGWLGHWPPWLDRSDEILRISSRAWSKSTFQAA